VLTIALTASICGCESCVEFADFAEDREQLFREFLHLENGLPSHDTFSRLLRLIDPEALSACFGRFLDALGADGGGVVAIDGKTLRRSFDRAAGASPLQVVTAFAAEAQLVIGQKAVAAGGNEITAARALLELLDLKGALVTADAIHCNAETARTVRARGGDYRDCQEFCVWGHSDADGGRIWRSRRTPWTICWRGATLGRFSPRTACSTS
jgi:hypothetical protein